MSKEPFLFRNIFNAERVDTIGGLLSDSWGQFDRQKFVDTVNHRLHDLSFGDRARKIRDALRDQLPDDFREAAKILVRALGPEPANDAIEGYEGFYVMPFTMYVSKYGLESPQVALPALYEMTKRFSAEGDIRPFLDRYPELTLDFLRRLTEDPSPFARRLPSEGTRPRLPLSGRLPAFQADPSPVIDLLDRLYRDPNLMVRRSVANNVNDIAKDNPDIAVATLGRWKRELHEAGAPESERENLDWMIRHGLRTLVKKDHPAALALLGYETLGIELEGWKLSTNAIRLDDKLTFGFTIHSSSAAPQRLALNYVIGFLKANGKQREKVFRLPDKLIPPGGSLTVTKTHEFKPYKNQSFYPGMHSIGIRINGEAYFKTPFTLETRTE